MPASTALLFTSYLPPLSYFAMLKSYGKVQIEQHEHFPKQTYRNRCHICSANGLLKLTIPVRKGEQEHTRIRDVRISYDFQWQKVHWRSIETAYRCSPFFEYYEDKLAPFYEKETRFLFDFNQELLDVLLPLAGISCDLSYTEKYRKDPGPEVDDYRSSLHPKPGKDRNAESLRYPEYMQVFSDRTGFLPNLSIVDLLFHEGPNAAAYLGQCLTISDQASD
jgi:hypothetical protein